MADGIQGAEKFLTLSKALKAAGQTGLRKELHNGIQQAAKPVIKEVRAAALSSLPSGGGLNAHVAKTRARIRVKTGRDPGVDVAWGRRQPGYMDGAVRHPVFKTGRWVTQQVDGDWFDGTVEKAAPVVRPEIDKAIESICDKIVRSV